MHEEQIWSPLLDLRTDLREDGSLDQQGCQSHYDPIAEIVYWEVEGEVTQDADDDGGNVDGDDDVVCQVVQVEGHCHGAEVTLRIRTHTYVYRLYTT